MVTHTSRGRGTRVKVEVNDRVNLYVAVKLKGWVDVEVLVEVDDPVPTAVRRFVLQS